jgi:hygromycin-B 7''-O-kinase
LRGMLGAEVWPTLPEDQKERILGQIGETIAEVQRAPVGVLSGIEPRWEPFMQKQIEGCRARHRRLGLPRKYWEGLDEIVRDAATLIPMNTAPVILTGEYIPENLLLSSEGEAWRLSGLIDFGDVLTGWSEYDLLGPSAFMTAGMPRRVRSLFGGGWIRAGGCHAHDEAAADGAVAASSLQRSDPAPPYRGLATKGRHAVRTRGIDLAGLKARRVGGVA